MRENQPGRPGKATSAPELAPHPTQDRVTLQSPSNGAASPPNEIAAPSNGASAEAGPEAACTLVAGELAAITPPEGEQVPTAPEEAHAPKGWGRLVHGAGVALALGAAAAGSILLFRMLNRTKVHGLRNIPTEHENVLYCLNHNSILDSFAFEAAAYMPKLLFQRKYIPVSLADRRNFFGDPEGRRFKDWVLRFLGQHFFRHLRAWPVDRKTGDMGQVDKWVELLKENIVIVFPEGTRTRTGEIGTGKPGVGKLIYEARPTVVPVRMTGTGEVLGVGCKVPKVFRTVEVWIGETLDLADLLDRPMPEARNDQIAFFAEISDRVLDSIRALGPGTPLHPLEEKEQGAAASEGKAGAAAAPEPGSTQPDP